MLLLSLSAKEIFSFIDINDETQVSIEAKNEINLHLMKNNSECINSLATAKDENNVEKTTK